jgi:hypothetical protein
VPFHSADDARTLKLLLMLLLWNVLLLLLLLLPLLPPLPLPFDVLLVGCWIVWVVTLLRRSARTLSKEVQVDSVPK